MYHSHLLINTGDNPDRPDWSIARRWLRNLYRVHQRLSMAFPSTSQAAAKDRLAAYCAPYNSSCYPTLQELSEECEDQEPCAARRKDHGFLFRIDYPIIQLVNGEATRANSGVRRPVIIVQSAKKPDWHHAFGLDEDAVNDRGAPIGNASFLLAEPPQVKEIGLSVEHGSLSMLSPAQHLQINSGDQVRFRLLANPSCKRDKKRHRPRVSDEAFHAGGEMFSEAFRKVHEDWLERKLGDAAEAIACFTLDDEGRRIDRIVMGWARGWRTKYEIRGGQQLKWWSVLFEGTFRVKDVEVLKTIIESGIGSGKAFGFGLLSVARV